MAARGLFLLSPMARPHALSREKRQAIRERFKTLPQTPANFAAVGKEWGLSWQTIQRYVRGYR